MKRPLIITVVIIICLASAARLIQASTLSAPPQELNINATVGNPSVLVLYTPTNIASSSMTLIWSQNLDSNFAMYKIYYSTTPGVDETDNLIIEITDQATVTTLVSGLAPSTTYYFKALVQNSLDMKTFSNEVYAQTADSAGHAVQPPPIPAPTIAGLDVFQCPVFSTPVMTYGTKDPQINQIFVNDDSSGVDFPNISSWRKLLAYILGFNQFIVYGTTPVGQRSPDASYLIPRYQIGDVNGDSKINDYDLSGLAWHWGITWCPADFNLDRIVNDFDLAGLGAHWAEIINY